MGRRLQSAPLGWDVFRNAAGEWLAVQCQYQGGKLMNILAPRQDDGSIMTWGRRYRAVSELSVLAVMQENALMRERLAELDPSFSTGRIAALSVS